MFDLVSETWNPVVGCLHDCVYCWARRLAETKLRFSPRYKQGFKPQLVIDELRRSFKDGQFVFVSSMGDLFGEWVPRDWVRSVLAVVEEWSATRFLLLTKNPERFHEFKLPRNAVVGATVESNRVFPVSKALSCGKRLEAMANLDSGVEKMLSVEPIMDFDLDTLVEGVRRVKPKFVYVGYDNYGSGLVEPSLVKTKALISALERFTIVRRKTIREATAALSGKLVSATC